LFGLPPFIVTFLLSNNFDIVKKNRGN